MHRKLLQNCLFGLVAGVVSHVALAQYAWTDERGVRQYSDQPPPKSISNARILHQPAESLRSNAPALPANTPAAPRAGASAAESPTIAQPAGIAAAPAATATTPATAATTTAPKPPLTTADKNADFLKRKAETEEKEKKQAEEARLAAAKARQCEQARGYASSLQSGERIAVTGKDGERSYMSDEKRLQESAEARRVLAGCKV